MSLANFGSGRLYGTRNDVAGGTPREFGVLQGVKLDFEFTTKPLQGSNQWPVFIARGEGKLSVTAETAELSGSIIGELFFGIAPVAGQLALAAAENHNVPAETTYIATIAPPNSGVFAGDEGVIYAAGANAGEPLEQVAAAPTQGQYMGECWDGRLHIRRSGRECGGQYQLYVHDGDRWTENRHHEPVARDNADVRVGVPQPRPEDWPVRNARPQQGDEQQAVASVEDLRLGNPVV